MKLKVLKCPNCDAPLENSEDLDIMYCKYCGYKIIMDELTDGEINAKVKIKEMKHIERMQKSKYDQEQTRWERKEKSKTNNALREILPIAGFFLAFGVLFLFILVYSGSMEKQSIKQEEQLQKIVEEVMIDIKNEDYSSARIKAETIYYTEGWSSDIEKKWDATRKQLLEEIDEAEKAKKKENGEGGGWFDWFN